MSDTFRNNTSAVDAETSNAKDENTTQVNMKKKLLSFNFRWIVKERIIKKLQKENGKGSKHAHENCCEVSD